MGDIEIQIADRSDDRTRYDRFGSQIGTRPLPQAYFNQNLAKSNIFITVKYSTVFDNRSFTI